MRSMKIHAFVLLTLSIMAIFFSCSKKKSGPATVVMSATVNGLPWTSTYSTVHFDKVPTLHITIHADSNNTNFNFDINPYTGVDTYLISSSNKAYFTSYSLTQGSITDNADSGRIIITDSYPDGEAQTTIKGKFNFKSGNALTVDNGVFVVSLGLN